MRGVRTRVRSRRHGILGALVVGSLVVALLELTGAAGYAASGSTYTWHMDETSGSTMVDSTGGHDGTIENVTLGRSGESGTAFGFNGTSSRVIVPDDAALDPNDADVHISLWMRTTTKPAVPDYDLFRKGQAPGQEYKIEMQTNGQASCDFRGSLASSSVQNGPDLSDGSWHHIQCDKTSSTIALTVDGQTYSKSRSVGSITNGYNVVIGAYPSGDFYQGDLDEVTMTFGSGGQTPSPTASFTASPTSGAAPLKVQFKDTSTGSPSSWAWDFGDGASSAQQSPTHTYDQPGTYTVTLTAANASGSDSAHQTVQVDDVTAPTGRFTVSPTSAWSGWTRVAIRQQSISDDGTPAGQIRRVVRWGDGTGSQTWSSGTVLRHVYRGAGAHTPQVRLTDDAGNTRVVQLGKVSVSQDQVAPSVRLDLPSSRDLVSSWRRLHGTVHDHQSGVARVVVRVVQKRHGHWVAYQPGTGWVSASSRAAAVHAAGWVRVVPGAGAWSQDIPGLRRGTLLVRLTARDHAGNRAAVRSYRFLLRRL